MPNFRMAEQYGYPVECQSAEAKGVRDKKWCPFQSSDCSKSGGVCSITDEQSYPITCPKRFQQNGLMYDVIARTAFGSNAHYIVLKEIAFLDPYNRYERAGAVGNIDNIVVEIDDTGAMKDWCALEVQAVYFSGSSMRKEIEDFSNHGIIREPGSRRPDFRSSGPKRLLPQLETKVPTLRRWGKKMFVAIDKPFMEWLPPMKEENDISNCDICWMSFGLQTSEAPYQLFLDRKLFVTLESSREGLVAGISPPLSTFEKRIENALKRENKISFESR